MKTIEEAAKRYVINLSEGDVFGRLKQPRGAGVELINAFTAGAAFAQRWIPVSEELPEENTEVLITCLNGKRIQHDVDFIMNGVFHRRKNVTHWRPIELNS